MKIKDNLRTYTEFASIKEGMAFKCVDAVYIKTKEVMDGPTTFYNSVNLATGEHMYMGAMVRIEPLPDAMIMLDGGKNEDRR